MNALLRVCMAVSVAVIGTTFAEVTLAQSTISDIDVARLRAFIGSTEFDASSPSVSPSPSSGAVVGGIYKVRSGDTLSEIMATHLGDTGVNHDVMQQVIVKNNKSAFRRGNPHWLMAGASLRMPTVSDVMDYVVPGRDGKKTTASSDDWVRYP